jgi:hypothetical protein
MKNRMSSWELLRGIINFSLSIILVISMAAGQPIAMVFGMLGLILTNFDLLKDNFGTRKNLVRHLAKEQ